ncbi:hypothetical protein THAOC_32544, partial [Thalassiosira oceanica]
MNWGGGNPGVEPGPLDGPGRVGFSLKAYVSSLVVGTFGAAEQRRSPADLPPLRSSVCSTEVRPFAAKSSTKSPTVPTHLKLLRTTGDPGEDPVIPSPTAVTANESARKQNKGRRGEVVGLAWSIAPCHLKQSIAMPLRQRRASRISLGMSKIGISCGRYKMTNYPSCGFVDQSHPKTTNEDYYGLGSSRELDWLGHFVKKSTGLEGIGISGDDTFGNCSGHSVDRFLDNLGKCNHIKKMHFAGTNLAEIIYKLGPAMKSNNFTQFFVEECHLGVPEATFLFNTFRDMNSLEELCIDCDDEEEGLANLNDGDMAGCIPSLAACTGMRSLKLNYLNLSTSSFAAMRGVFPRISALRELVLRRNSLDDDCTRLLAQGLSEELNIGANLLSGGTGVIAASLANPECRLISLNLNGCNIGDEGTATLADGLSNNQRLTRMSLGHNNITEPHTLQTTERSDDSPNNGCLLASNNSPFPSMSNMAFHDLTINQFEPTSSRTTLGLGLKFVVTPTHSSPKSKIKPAIDIFERRVKLSVFYAGEEGEAPNTKLRVASKWTPPAAMMPPQVINRLAAFHHSLLSLYKRQKGTPNISNSQRRRLRQLKHDQNIIT